MITSTRWHVRSGNNTLLDTLTFRRPVTEYEARLFARQGWLGKVSLEAFTLLIFEPS